MVVSKSLYAQFLARAYLTVSSHLNISLECWKQLSLCRKPLTLQPSFVWSGTKDIPDLQQTRCSLLLRRRYITDGLSGVS